MGKNCKNIVVYPKMSTIFSKIVRKHCLHACNFFHVWCGVWCVVCNVWCVVCRMGHVVCTFSVQCSLICVLRSVKRVLYQFVVCVLVCSIHYVLYRVIQNDRRTVIAYYSGQKATYQLRQVTLFSFYRDILISTVQKIP